MKKRGTFILILLFSALFFSQIVGATTYYVATNGSDSAAGSVAYPWKTIQKAANTLQPGDTVLVQPGTYYANPQTDSQVHVTRSGKVGAPITYKAIGIVKITGFVVNADYISIKGFDIIFLGEGRGIEVDSGGYCDIENNFVHLSTGGGIILQGYPTDTARTHDCLVKNNTIYRNGMVGIEVKGRNHLIVGNDVSETIQHHPCNIKFADVSWLDADGFHFHGGGHIFANNSIHNITYGPNGWTQGTSCSIANLENLNNDYNDDPHIDCWQTLYDSADKEVGHDIIFEQNYCENLDNYPALSIGGKGFQVGDGYHYNLLIRNNIIKANGLGLFQGSNNVSILNNNLIGKANAVGIYVTSTTNMTIQNNIFAYQENGIGTIWPNDASKPTLTAGYNCVYRMNNATPWRAADPGDVWRKDPLFVDEAAGDYRLKAGSPCIDKGIRMPRVPNDYVGNPRPRGMGYDIGAYEYVPQSAGRIYYVDCASGNDANNGASTDSPWQTLNAVNTHSFLPGDTVLLKRGCSWTGGLAIHSSGSPASPITITAYGTGEKPTISKAGNLSQYPKAIAIDASWIIIRGFLLKDTYYAGVEVRGNHNIITDNEIRHSGGGVYLLGTQNLVTNNSIHDLTIILSNPGGNDDYGAVGVWLFDSNNEVSYNILKNCRAPSLDYGYDGGGVETYGPVNNSYIHHNWVEGCAGFLEMGGGGIHATQTNNTIAYNVLINNTHVLHFNLGNTPFSVSLGTLYVDHNTIIEQEKWDTVINLVYGNLTPSQLYFRNNIVDGYYNFARIINSTGGTTPYTSFTHTNNLFRGIGVNFTPGTGEIFADPLFINKVTRNFTLSPTSPAIDKAANLGYSIDYPGAHVPQGIAPDIGAYEYVAGAAFLAEDINMDHTVDMQDINLVIADFGKSGGYNARCDLDRDGKIGLNDIIGVAKRLGASA